MSRTLLIAAAFTVGVGFASTGALAYVAALPVPIPAAFEGPMNPFAACAADAQEQFLAGAAFDSFMHKCTQTAVASICDDWASAKKVPGKARAAFTRKCVAAIEQTERY